MGGRERRRHETRDICRSCTMLKIEVFTLKPMEAIEEFSAIGGSDVTGLQLKNITVVYIENEFK